MISLCSPCLCGASSGDMVNGYLNKILPDVALRAGRVVVQINSDDSSQICARCNNLVPKDLSVRQHDCWHCGFLCHRDVNAAINILKWGLEQSPQGRQVKPVVVPVLSLGG